MQDDQRKPTCPKCQATNVTYVGDNSNLAAGILHPKTSRSLVRAYKCECGTAFTFTIAAPQVQSETTGR